MAIATPQAQIRKFFLERHFDFLSSVPQRRIQEIILASSRKVYRNECPLNKTGRAAVLFSYPKQAFGKRSTLWAFLCSDLFLSDDIILAYYSQHREIEVFFRTQKRYLGLKALWSEAQKHLTVCLLSFFRLPSSFAVSGECFFPSARGCSPAGTLCAFL